ncbi:hypothetical protein THAOC_30422 [Thalassiosira oceanica]|uniref:Uncharacterized protein n=1 Tax=Thalassiosira oceanica TaxID=159749 RepID=K0RE89_THAOC|nr:hypothetical protein THAOC_30422 [Thalassiosira oceanica]|eukprot:EJK50554.1 hypothetical protein THAOC_30422 [Thalassiosira oceanica]
MPMPTIAMPTDKAGYLYLGRGAAASGAGARGRKTSHNLDHPESWIRLRQETPVIIKSETAIMNHQCPESPESDSFPSPSAPPRPRPSSVGVACPTRSPSPLSRDAATNAGPPHREEPAAARVACRAARRRRVTGSLKGPVNILAAASAAMPSGTPRRPLRRSTFSKVGTTPMTKLHRTSRRRVTFPSNDGVVPEFIALSLKPKGKTNKTNHPGVGQRDEVAELRLELCNQKRLVADLHAQIQSVEQSNSASIPEDVNDVSEPSHTACDEHGQIDELKLELAKEWGRNAALSSRVDSLSDVEARNRILEEENEELRRAVAEIQDKMSSFRCNVAKTLTQSGKSSGTEETVQGIMSSDSDSGSVCSGTFTQSAGEASCFGERGAREEAEDCCDLKGN